MERIFVSPDVAMKLLAKIMEAGLSKEVAMKVFRDVAKDLDTFERALEQVTEPKKKTESVDGGCTIAGPIEYIPPTPSDFPSCEVCKGLHITDSCLLYPFRSKTRTYEELEPRIYSLDNDIVFVFTNYPISVGRLIPGKTKNLMGTRELVVGDYRVIQNANFGYVGTNEVNHIRAFDQKLFQRLFSAGLIRTFK